jgi:predicted ArsR family transcriptional regulator
VGSRHRLLLLLRKQPGVTVAELARAMAISDMGVRRHLTALAAEGLVEQAAGASAGLGRPPAGWRLSGAGRELFPRRYDVLALDVMGELAPDELAGALSRRNDKQVAQYREALAPCADLGEQVVELTRLRDNAGYQAEWSPGDGDTLMLTENNCAIHRVAESHPAVCAMELSLFRQVLGPDVEVTRLTHAIAGDASCTYCIRPRRADPE